MAADKRNLEDVYNCFEDAIRTFREDYTNDIFVGKVDLEEAYTCLADTIQAFEQHLVSDVLSVKAFTDKKKSDIALHWCKVREWYTVLFAKLQKDVFSIKPAFDDTPQIIIEYAKNERPE